MATYRTQTMKKFTLFCLTILSVSAFAQQLEGVVYYNQKMDMHRRMTTQSAEIKAMIPQFRSSEMVLSFTTFQSLYKPVPKEEEDEPEAVNGVRIKIQTPQNETYKNFNVAEKTELKTFFGKKFLVEDTLRQLPWKLTDARKKILGYDCTKATCTNAQKQNIVGWFAETIGCPSGPDAYDGLPGLLLEIDVNEGESTFTATKIELRKLKDGELTVSSGGKKTTAAEFKKIVDERMKEMGGSGGSGFKIIRN